jgi:acyl transferase domain-containing protein/acyl carrier protein
MADNEKLRSYLNRVTVDLRQTRRRLEEVEERQSEPIAIIGMACHYPGGVSCAEDLWQLVTSGGDGISPFPADRGWDLEALYDPDPDNPGTSYAREGGFLTDVGGFDPGFFGISPREALAMDPQQRLLLEAAWEAFEDAGIDPVSLKGSQTGVFAGISSSDYGVGLGGAASEGYRMTGRTSSVGSGRVAYTFGFEGPAVSVDTACSSSLVTLHLACQSLRGEECSLALAGGVMVLAWPGLFVEFARQRILSPDGRCKSFANAADGAGFAEGVGLVLLERLSDAQRNGRQVLAVVRGSAVNQDGASNGLTAPNGPSQQRVIARALASARLVAAQVDVVEAHGTGTTLGDLIEAQALIAAYGQGRPQGRPLRLGSVKSNIGHTGTAAGVAGVIKMVQALRHGALPKTLHVDRPSGQVDWEAGAVELLTEQVPWERNGEPRRAGVSSFGISGTNAHVILEEAPIPSQESVTTEDDPARVLTGGVVPWVLSGKSERALRGQTARLREFVERSPGLDVNAVGGALVGRSVFEHRAVVDGGLEGLGVLAEGVAGDVGSGVVWLFPGQGSQWVGMGRELLECSGVFARRLEECGEALEPFVGFSVVDVLRGGEELDRVDVVQPVLFAVMVSLAELWRACGVCPDVVVGHSQGEIAAACVAGGLSLEDAARVVGLRSKVLLGLGGRGGMVSVGADVSVVEGLLEGFGGRLGVAAVNGPRSVVVSGDADVLEEFVGVCEGGGVWARKIPVDYASHSVHVEDVRGELLGACEGIVPRTGEVPFYSTVTGALFDMAGLDGEYWFRGLRERVRFAEVTRVLLGEGYRVLVEVSPHPVLTVGVQECVDEVLADGDEVVVVGSLRRGEGGPERFVRSLGELWVRGVEVDWGRLCGGCSAVRVGLPSYAFQRERFWLEGGVGGDVAGVGQVAVGHPLLGARVALAGERGWVFTGRLSLGDPGWLAEHVVLGAPVVPGTTFVELALYAGSQTGCELVGELIIEAPLVLPEQGGVQLQVYVGEPEESGARPIGIYSRQEGAASDDLGYVEEGEWTRHANGTLVAAWEDSSAEAALQERASLLAGAWPPAGAVAVDIDDFYGRTAELGLDYGPAFLGVRALWRRGEELFAELALAEEERAQAGEFGVHPALLDAGLQAFTANLSAAESDGSWLRLPFAFNGVELYTRGVGVLRAHLTLVGTDGMSLVGCDENGVLAVVMRSLIVREISREQLTSATAGHGDSQFALQWNPTPTPTSSLPIGECAVLGAAESGLAGALYGDLEALGKAVEGGVTVPDVVFIDCALGEAEWASEQRDAVSGVGRWALGLVQEWLADERFAHARLVLVTRGAVSVDAEEGVAGLAQAPVWGLVRSAQSESPERLVLIDVDGSESVALLGGALATDEPQLAIRRGGLLVPRLSRIAPRADAEPTTLGGAGTVLITGGTGTLGGVLARHLARSHGVEHMLLTSRRGLEAEGAVELQMELEALGVSVTIAACDVSDRASLQRLLDGIPRERPLRAVVHAAGALDDGVIGSLTAARLDRVFAPKADAAWHLHQLTAHLDLRAFVLFSSAAGTLGSPGQGNYAAANAFLDALAADRRARGLAGVSIAWGLWEQASGITGSMSEADRSRMARAGLGALTSERALGLFDAALAVDEAFVFCAPLELGALRAQARMGVLPALFGGLVRMPARRSGERGASLARRLAGVPEEEREGAVLGIVRDQVAAALGHRSAETVDPQQAFKDAGFDSLSAVELRNRLNSVTGLRLPATLVFDYPTPAAVAGYLLREVSGLQVSVAAPAVARAALDEPLAIVGMSCRYPGGVRSPQGLWQLVLAGEDGVSALPGDRGWDLEALYDPDPDRPGTCYAREGGFLLDAGEFDAGFFGIGPREALAMDPQQRLLLEAAWEAFENACIDPATLRGSRTGVFAGISSSAYGMDLHGAQAESLEGYRLTGGSNSVASGRVAYTFGLEGPAVSVDTACSSSLVAIHLARQALRAGECELALAGGVTVLTSPGLLVEFARQRGLAPNGRCKSFANAADGVGWGEGVGLLLLERLTDAQRNGHQVLGLIRGSAVNQDGASNGLTAPNGPSQQRVIAQALASAGLSPAQVDAVEAHGTGTILGDPIEAQALIAAYGQGRPQGQPLWLGSVKSNIGHTGTAAGVAGVIKMVQALRQGVLPKTLHVDEPSVQVDWSAGEVALLTEQVPWERDGEPRRAGVSAFGISGTNAHVILEEAPTVAADTGGVAAGRGDGAGVVAGGVVPWVLSGRSGAALQGQAGRLREFLESAPDASVGDVGRALVNRAAFEHRAVVMGTGREGLSAGLQALIENEPAGVVRGVTDTGGGLAFLFSGQGSQWVGMGRELDEAFGVFRDALSEVCGILDDHLGRGLLGIMFGSEDAGENGLGGRSETGLLDRTVFAQAGLFALEVALFRLLDSWGVRPRFVTGHSVGELVAAHVAGVLALEDACALVAARGQLMGDLPRGGAMVSIAAAEADVLESLAGLEGHVSLAAVNGPLAVVISGDEDVVLDVAAVWEERGARTKRLRVSHAFHSPRMDEMLEEFTAVARGISFGQPTIPVVSNLTGAAAEEIGSAEYWVRHVREPVRFLDGARWLYGRGARNFLELGPDGVLSAIVQECLAGERSSGDGAPIAAVPVLRRGRPEAHTFINALAELWVRGIDVDWGAAFAGAETAPVVLPTYAFQRERYWLSRGPDGGDPAAIGQAAAGHPLLGAAVAMADDRGWIFTGSVSLASHPWLEDHAVMGHVLLAGTAFLELALHAGGQVGCPVVGELALEAPLVFSAHGAVHLQVSVGEADEAGERPLGIYSREAHPAGADALSAGEWTRHASGVLAPAVAQRRPDATSEAHAALLAGEQWPPLGAEPIEIDDLYGRLLEQGVEYGPVFQGLRAAWRREDDVFAEVSLPAGELEQAHAYGIHPALLDSAFHTVLGLPAGAAPGGGGLRLPFSFAGVELHAAGASSLRVCLSAAPGDTVSLAVADDTGALVASIDSLVARELPAAQLRAAGHGHGEALLGMNWTEVTAAPDAATSDLVVLGGEDPALAASLGGLGHAVEVHADLVALRGAIEERGAVPGAVLVEFGAGGAEQGAQGLPQRTHELLTAALSLMQAWLADECFAGSRLVLVTRGAVVARPGDELNDLAGAPLWGLVRSAQSEHPAQFVLIDVDGSESRELLSAALGTDESQLAVRGGNILGPRLVRATQQTPADRNLLGDGGATVGGSGTTALITGGTGTLGSVLAKHLVVQHGVSHLLLTSRRGPAAEHAPRLREELEGLGAQVTIAACDASDREALQRLLESILADAPLRVVVHAAGVVDDGVIGSLTAERLDRVLAPKADAAWHLHELTEHLDLRAFVLFSSAAGTLGAPGQGNYAAANAFLDGLTAYRRARGLVGVSLAWGLWEQASAITASLSEANRARMSRSGLGALSSEHALELFDTALGIDEAFLFCAPLDLGMLRAQAGLGVLPALLGALVRMPVRRSAEQGAALARRLAAASAEEREGVVMEVVRGQVAAVLGHASPEAVDPQRAFKEAGFDSLSAVELRNRLSTATGLRLPATLVFDYPTPATLAAYLIDELPHAGSAGSLNAELDKLGAMLAAVSADDAARPQIAARLKTYLSQLDDTPKSLDRAALAEKLHAASDDELFEFFDERPATAGTLDRETADPSDETESP